MKSFGQITQAWAEQSQIPVWYQAITTSTNRIAKETVIEDSPVSLYVADFQSEGRGRGTHTWVQSDVADSAFLSSWVFQMRKAPQPVLSAAIGLAVWTALKSSFPWLPLSLKAPNDLYLEDKKVAGILLENVPHQKANGESAHRLIVGLGINVLKAPAGLEDAGALSDMLGLTLTEQNWIHVLDRLLLEISLGISQTGAQLNETQQRSLLSALNAFPKLSVPYLKVEGDGSLWSSLGQTHWSDL